MNYAIDILPTFDYGLFDQNGLLLADFPTYSHAERAARNLFGYAPPAPLDPVLYSGDMDAAADSAWLDVARRQRLTDQALLLTVRLGRLLGAEAELTCTARRRYLRRRAQEAQIGNVPERGANQ